MQKKRLVGITGILFVTVLIFFLSFAFAETIILKSGAKIEGKVVKQTDADTFIEIHKGEDLFVLPNYEIEIIERDEAVISLKPSEGTIYVNDDIGIKISGPSGWYMYSAEELAKSDDATKEAAGELSKEIELSQFPARTKVVEFTKYPFAKVFPNPIISLSFFDMSNAPSELIDPINFINFKLSKLQRDSKNFEILKEPKKIVINTKEGSRATVKYSVPVYNEPKEFKQIVCFFPRGVFGIEVVATNVPENFDIDKEAIEQCIQSLEIADIPGPKPAENHFYKVVGGGFVFKSKEKKANYVLLLKPKVKIKDSYYAEIEYDNPSNPNSPILVSTKVISLLELLAEEETLVLESPILDSLKPFKMYNITLRTYESEDKNKLIDTLNQKIISFFYY